MDGFPTSWGSSGPWKGTLTITAKTPGVPPTVGAVMPNGSFDHDGYEVRVYGGFGKVSTGPIC